MKTLCIMFVCLFSFVMLKDSQRLPQDHSCVTGVPGTWGLLCIPYCVSHQLFVLLYISQLTCRHFLHMITRLTGLSGNVSKIKRKQKLFHPPVFVFVISSYVFPKTLLSHHFWTEQQRQEFWQTDLKHRLQHMAPVLDNMSLMSRHIPDEEMEDKVMKIVNKVSWRKSMATAKIYVSIMWIWSDVENVCMLDSHRLTNLFFHNLVCINYYVVLYYAMLLHVGHRVLGFVNEVCEIRHDNQ